MPLVSVIVAYYQHEKYIGETIASLLAQTLQDIEIIVVDDKSTDGGMAIVESFNDPRIRTIYRPYNGGPSAALNDGIKVAHSAHIALTGSDDVSEPWRLEHQLSYLGQRKASIAFSTPTLINGEGRELHDQIFPIFFRHQQHDTSFSALRSLFVQGNTYCAPTALLEADLFRELGFFDESLIQLQDYDFWLRACCNGHTIALGQRRVTRYRLHGANLSHQKNDDKMRGELMRCYVKLLRDCPADAFAKAFPEMVSLGSHEVSYAERALIALRHGSTMVQSIGKSMLLDLLESNSQSGSAPIMDDSFIAAAISSELLPELQLQPNLE